MTAFNQFIWWVIMVIRLLFDDSTGIEADENQNVTALHIACSLNMVKLLIESQRNKHDIVKDLLQWRAADMEARKYDGLQTIHLAGYHGN